MNSWQTTYLLRGSAEITTGYVIIHLVIGEFWKKRVIKQRWPWKRKNLAITAHQKRELVLHSHTSNSSSHFTLHTTTNDYSGTFFRGRDSTGQQNTDSCTFSSHTAQPQRIQYLRTSLRLQMPTAAPALALHCILFLQVFLLNCQRFYELEKETFTPDHLNLCFVLFSESANKWKN